MKKRNLILACFVSGCSLLHAQTRETDSLEKRLKNPGTGTAERLVLYNQLAEKLAAESAPRTMYYGNLALQLARRTNDIAAQARALNAIGDYYEQVDNYDSSVYILRMARNLRPLKDPKLSAKIESNLGLAYFRLGSTDSAFAVFGRALEMHTALKDSAQILNVLNNMAILHCMNGNYDKGQLAFLECLRFHEKAGDSISVARDYNNLGLVMNEKKMFGQAAVYFQKALGTGLRMNDTMTIFRAYQNLALIGEGQNDFDRAIQYNLQALNYLAAAKKAQRSTIEHALSTCFIEKGEYLVALKYVESSLKAKEELAEKNSIEGLLINLAAIRYHLGKYPEAIEAAKRASQITEETGSLESKTRIAELLADCYIQTGDRQNAKKMYALYRQLNDSFYDSNLSASIAETSARFETGKKEQENLMLKQKNLLNRMELVSNEQKLDTRNAVIAALAAALVLAIVLVSWRMNVIRLRKKAEELEAARKMQHEKERISRDLHDHVGGQLSYVLYTLDGLDEQPQAIRDEQVKSINDSIRNVTGSLRETIWAISDEALHVSDLTDRLKVYARNMFRFTEVKVRFNEAIVNDHQLKSLVSLNLLRICQEIINNSFKHAGASELEIAVRAEQHITITIRDNGKGFVQETVAEGYGLGNIRKRAAESGVQLRMQSTPGNGTVFTLLV